MYTRTRKEKPKSDFHQIISNKSHAELLEIMRQKNIGIKRNIRKEEALRQLESHYNKYMEVLHLYTKPMLIEMCREKQLTWNLSMKKDDCIETLLAEYIQQMELTRKEDHWPGVDDWLQGNGDISSLNHLWTAVELSETEKIDLDDLQDWVTQQQGLFPIHLAIQKYAQEKHVCIPIYGKYVHGLKWIRKRKLEPVPLKNTNWKEDPRWKSGEWFAPLILLLQTTGKESDTVPQQVVYDWIEENGGMVRLDFLSRCGYECHDGYFQGVKLHEPKPKGKKGNTELLDVMEITGNPNDISPLGGLMEWIKKKRGDFHVAKLRQEADAQGWDINIRNWGYFSVATGMKLKLPKKEIPALPKWKGVKEWILGYHSDEKCLQHLWTYLEPGEGNIPIATVEDWVKEEGGDFDVRSLFHLYGMIKKEEFVHSKLPLLQGWKIKDPLQPLLDAVEIVEKKECKKKSIPKSVKTDIWNTHVGADIMKHRCLCCKKGFIHITDFHVGHVKSEKDGGTMEINNLRPICATCNHSMGTMNMETFVKTYGYYI